MREGSVYRRCTRNSCRSRVGAGARNCPKCHGESLSWSFTVDLAPAGAPRRQRQSGGFPTKAAAVEAMTRLQIERSDGIFVEPSKATLGAYLSNWLGARNDITGNTRRDYEVSIRKHIGPRIGAVPLQAVDRLQVRALYRTLADSGLSQKTVHNVHIALRKALADAVEDGLLRRNPADGAHSRPKDRPEMATWSAAELHAFLEQVSSERDAALWRLAAMSGMRRGELLGLRRHDVDLHGARLTVRQQYTRQGTATAFCPPKSRKSTRTIDLDAATVDTLRDHLEAQGFDRRAWRDAYRADLDLVFCRPDGAPLYPEGIDRRFHRLQNQAGARAIRLHDLRHTHATLLLEEGVDVKTVSERLGHDGIQTTLELYGHVTPRMRLEAATRFATAVDGAGSSAPRAVAGSG